MNKVLSGSSNKVFNSYNWCDVRLKELSCRVNFDNILCSVGRSKELYCTKGRSCNPAPDNIGLQLSPAALPGLSTKPIINIEMTQCERPVEDITVSK